MDVIAGKNTLKVIGNIARTPVAEKICEI